MDINYKCTEFEDLEDDYGLDEDQLGEDTFD